MDYSDIIKTIVADTGDITEEPNANKNSGIDLDELIDRRKVDVSTYLSFIYQNAC